MKTFYTLSQIKAIIWDDVKTQYNANGYVDVDEVEKLLHKFVGNNVLSQYALEVAEYINTCVEASEHFGEKEEA